VGRRAPQAVWNPRGRLRRHAHGCEAPPRPTPATARAATGRVQRPQAPQARLGRRPRRHQRAEHRDRRADPDPVRRASAHGQDSPAITRRARRAVPELLGHDGENEGDQREHHQRGHALSVREREQRHQRDGRDENGHPDGTHERPGRDPLRATTAQPPPVVRAQRKRRRRRLNHGGPTLPYFPRHRLRDERKERPPQDYRESPTSTTLFSRRNASQETSDWAAPTSAGRAPHQDQRHRQPDHQADQDEQLHCDVDAPKARIESWIPLCTRTCEQPRRRPPRRSPSDDDRRGGACTAQTALGDRLRGAAIRPASP
jgi:hypothetical protein